VYELEQVAVNCSREYSLHNCFPAGNDGKVHRCLDFIGAGGRKLFLLVTYHGAESLNVVRRYGDLWASKRITDAKLWKLLFVTKPQLPVELLDARIAALHNLVNRGVGL
jgi:hypothetical protein